jgi:transcriptional regulator with XRE-family HTH domain
MPRFSAVAKGANSRALPIDENPAVAGLRCPFVVRRPSPLRPCEQRIIPQIPKPWAEHLKKRRRQLCLLQREAAERMGISKDTYVNWEKGKTKPVPSQFKPVVAFLGYDPTPAPLSLPERVEAKRRILGATLDQVAQYLGWDEASLRRYLKGEWRLSQERAEALERFLRLSVEEAVVSVLAITRRSR